MAYWQSLGMSDFDRGQLVSDMQAGYSRNPVICEKTTTANTMARVQNAFSAPALAFA
jgi:hypothetical protein